jgi:purine-cytosine permease-like protein
MEHFIFRRGIQGYELEQGTDSGILPPGIAATVATLFGILGAVLGMAQAWYVSPLGKLTGNPEFGGDIGFELAFAFTVITYVPCRVLEKRRFKR